MVLLFPVLAQWNSRCKYNSIFPIMRVIDLIGFYLVSYFILFLVLRSLCLNDIGTLLINCITIFQIIYWYQTNNFLAWFYFRRLNDDNMFMIIWHSTVPTSCYIFFGIPIFICFPTYSVGKSCNWRRSETISILANNL